MMSHQREGNGGIRLQQQRSMFNACQPSIAGILASTYATTAEYKTGIEEPAVETDGDTLAVLLGPTKYRRNQDINEPKRSSPSDTVFPSPWIVVFMLGFYHVLIDVSMNLVLFLLRTTSPFEDDESSFHQVLLLAGLVIFGASRLRRPSEPSLQQNHADDAGLILPRGLIVAALDDCPVIRTMIRSVFASPELETSSQSFVAGACLQECHQFASKVLAAKADIVILDENLDFDNGRISGTAVARCLRAKGYNGLLIQHSTEAGRPSLLRSQVFNGFIVKPCTRRSFIQSLATLYHNEEN